MSHKPSQAIQAARRLANATARLHFRLPVAFVYRPLEYAWAAHELYLRRFGGGRKRVLFLGMNPGPFGMAQTGVPFGEVAVVRDWMGIQAPVKVPEPMHPRRPIEGFRCARSEVSGRRLWGLFAARFETPRRFFAAHFVANYCPLVFMDQGGRNLTPDKLSASRSESLFAACDEHLRALTDALHPEWVIGVGDFAARRAQAVLAGSPIQVGRILHPSPASPAANRDWAGAATRQLQRLGVWLR